MLKLKWTALLFTTMVGGCATLDTLPYREHTQKRGEALRGVTYSLPMLQYEMKITRTLVECPGGQKDGEPTKLKFDVDVDTTHKYVPGEAYSVDYEALSGWFKVSNFEINYHPNGTLKSIGAGADDKTGDFLKDSAKLAAAAISLGTGNPAPAAMLLSPDVAASLNDQKAVFALQRNAPATGPEAVICTDEGALWTAELAALGEEKKLKTEELRKKTREISDLGERARLKLADKADRERLATLYHEQNGIDDRILEIETSEKDLRKKLATAESLTWPRRFNVELDEQTDHSADLNSVSALAKLLKKGSLPGEPSEESAVALNILTSQKAGALNLKGLDVDGIVRAAQRASALAAQSLVDVPAVCKGAESKVEDCVRYHVDLTAIVTSELGCKPDDSDIECVRTPVAEGPRYREARDAKVDSGLFVREPASGRLLVCRKMKRACTDEADLAEAEASPVPQLGQLRFLPFSTGMFQAKEIGVALAENGRIEKFLLKSTKAPAQTFSASAADVATQIDAALEKRETEERSDIEYARSQQTAAIEDEIKQLTKANELKKLKTPATPDPLQPVRDEIAANELEIARLEAILVRRLVEDAVDGSDAAALAIAELLANRGD